MMRGTRIFVSFIGSFLLAASVHRTPLAQTMTQPTDQQPPPYAAPPSPSYAPPAYGQPPPGYAQPGATYVESPPPSDAAHDSADRTEERELSRQDHFRIGVLGGVGFPRPLAIEGMVKLEKAIGLGLEYSVLPTFTVYGVETTFHALAADVRFFPLQGPFFLGFRAGRQHLGGDGTVSANGYSAAGSLSVDTTFVNPRIGFLWTFEPGISIGIDAGVQVPLSSSVASTLPVGSTASDEAMKVANTFGTRVLPTVDLIRLGFLL